MPQGRKSPSFIQHRQKKLRVNSSFLTSATAEWSVLWSAFICHYPCTTKNDLLKNDQLNHTHNLPPLPSKWFLLLLVWNPKPSPLPHLCLLLQTHLVPFMLSFYSFLAFFLFLKYTKLLPTSGPLHMLFSLLKILLSFNSSPHGQHPLSVRFHSAQRSYFPEKMLLPQFKVTATLGHYSTLYYIIMLCFP